jgi:hypothetical protein
MTGREVFRGGEWRLCERHGWPGNTNSHHVLAWCWRKDDERYLVVLNFHGDPAQARVEVPWDELRGCPWRLEDVLSDEVHDRSGDEMRDGGLYFELEPWKAQLFRMRAITPH